MSTPPEETKSRLSIKRVREIGPMIFWMWLMSLIFLRRLLAMLRRRTPCCRRLRTCSCDRQRTMKKKRVQSRKKVGHRDALSAIVTQYMTTEKVDNQTPENFVNTYINAGLAKLPIRLIDIDNKKMVLKASLYDELDVKRAEYINALKSKDRAEWDQYVLENIAPRVRFAIFSHRWGEHEPLLAEATDHISEWLDGVPDDAPAGIKKLVNFCDKAKNVYNLHLAWSDTCCIDKTSSSELQESISSMFHWYRGSDLCIAYMSETEKYGDAKRGRDGWKDKWFTRGWTLQELIAPTTMKFYSKGWEVLLPGEENDKKNEDMLMKLQDATGIERDRITDFVPGPDHLREKMIWVSQRTTTREEDIAYSLVGIFNVSLYINYGEGGEEAFYRLQEEIIKSTRDKGIFEWYGEPSKKCSMLASHPRCFRNPNDPFDLKRQEEIDVEDIVQQSLLTKLFCLCSGFSFWTSCMVQTFSCAVRVEVLVQSGEVINKGESHFAITNNGLQIKVDTIHVLHKWRLPHKDGYRRWYLTPVGHKRVKIAFASKKGKEPAIKKSDEFTLVPLTDEVVEGGRRSKARVAVLLYKVDSNTWQRVMTKDPIFLQRNQIKFNDNLLHTIYIR